MGDGTDTLSFIVIFPSSERTTTTPGGTRSSVSASGEVFPTAKVAPSRLILSLLLSLGCFVISILALIPVYLVRPEIIIIWSLEPIGFRLGGGDQSPIW